MAVGRTLGEFLMLVCAELPAKRRESIATALTPRFTLHDFVLELTEREFQHLLDGSHPALAVAAERLARKHKRIARQLGQTRNAG